MIPGPSSWPCNGRPASRRSVSRAPRPGGRHPGGQHRLPERAGRLGRHRALHAVLAGVAGPGHGHRHPVPVHPGHPEPLHRGRLGAHLGQPGPGLGTLDGDDGPPGGDVAGLHAPAAPAAAAVTRSVLEALGMTSKVCVVDPPHDDVVEHRGVLLVEQVGVLGPAGPDPAQVVGQGVLEPIQGGRPRHPHGAQVADVEGHRRVAAGPVLGQGAVGVAQGHVPAPELDQLGPEGPVFGVEGRGAQGHRARLASQSGGGAMGPSAASRSTWAAATSTSARSAPQPTSRSAVRARAWWAARNR